MSNVIDMNEKRLEKTDQLGARRQVLCPGFVEAAIRAGAESDEILNQAIFDAHVARAKALLKRLK